jgi:hypothetical protein
MRSATGSSTRKPEALMRRRALAWLALAALGGSWSAGARADARGLGTPVLLDGLAALVGGTTPGEGVLVILRSDVELRARLSLLAAGATDVTRAPLAAPLLKATLEELLGEALIAIEAGRLGLAAPTPGELAVARQALVPASASEQAFRELLASLSVSATELDEIARRRAVVGAFLAANLEGMLTPSESELVRAYQSEEHPFRGEPLSAVRERFSAWLAHKRLREAVGRWVLSLKERMPHRVLATF